MRTWISIGAVVLLSVGAIGVWAPQFSHSRSELTVSFLNVGQGDATFIESPTGVQILIDGGPDRSVLRELAAIMPWHDRTIDVVIATHPDADHISGLVDVLQRYEVSHILEPGVKHDTPQAESMLKSVAAENAEYTLARRGHAIDLGGGAFLEILFPDRDANDFETNTASIVARLVYGETSFLFTGDSPASIEKYLVALDGKALESDVLKVGHHGSNTSSALLFVGFVAPSRAVISRGCDNRYGHPHQEVLATLERFEIEVKDTCKDGTVTFISDGTQVFER